MTLLRRRAAPTAATGGNVGVVFPKVDGERSSQAAGRSILAAATSQIDTGISEAARDEPQWHAHYLQHFRDVTRLSAQQHAVQIASDGLAAVHSVMRYGRAGAETTIADALAGPQASPLASFATRGTGQLDGRGLAVPYRGTLLRDDALRRQLDSWQELGTAEPTSVSALRSVVDNPSWLDLRDTTVVVLGAGAELGPYRALLEWGANVVAVDVPGATSWRRLLDVAATSPGTLTVPLRGTVDDNPTDGEVCRAAGADVIVDTPEIATWLGELPVPFVLGDYVYAPGGVHVRSAVAIDAVVRHLLSQRSDIGLAYLATPTDCYAVTSEIVEASRAGENAHRPFVLAAHALSAGRFYQPNYPSIESTPDGLRFGIADGLVRQQGGNYALAKRIQRWRALHARSHGAVVSINVAPATSTRSVTQNRVLSAAYAGAHHFGLEVFEPATSSKLMAALLVHDLRSSTPLPTAGEDLSYPFDLLVRGSFHGGMWRSPYAPRSVLGLAVAAGLLPR